MLSFLVLLPVVLWRGPLNYRPKDIAGQFWRGGAHSAEADQDAGRSGVLKLKEGSLYPALYRLEAAKLTQGEWEADSSRRGPRRPRQNTQLAEGAD